MWRLSLLAFIFLASLMTPARAADFAGTWQAIIIDDDGLQFRSVFKLYQAESATWKGSIYVVDVDSNGFLSEGITVQGDRIKILAGRMGGVFEGVLSADGNSITGTWREAKTPRPLTLVRATPATAWPLDSSPHNIGFVTTSDGVRLEVLDWGGEGRSLIFIPGWGSTAHVFDALVPQLAADFHVYGITRRGFGNSAKPEPVNNNYSATRLGDDVLDVIAKLKLEGPVLVGHSFAGAELSSIATRHPEKIAGVIYLDAGYSYAYYAPDVPTAPPSTLPPSQTLEQRIDQAMRDGQEKFTSIGVPVLAIFATPHTLQQGELSAEEFAARQKFESRRDTQIAAFAKGVKQARVIKLPNAPHMLWLTNASDVVREITNFAKKLAP
jgi:pimeloyl-ACP methyl ester carboxylesterase